MSLNAQIDADYKTAFKAKDTFRVGVLRMLRAEIKNRAKDKQESLTDEEVIAVVRSQIKKRDEAAQAFAEGGNEEKAAQERGEGEMLKTYLPPELSEAALNALIASTVEEVGARGPGDLGKVMKDLMPKVAGRADGKLVNQKVRQALSEG